MIEINNKCKVEGCENKKRECGYCSKHYSQVLRHGRLTPETDRLKYSEKDVCKVDYCNRKPKCNGYCSTHYMQLKKTGELHVIIENQNKIIVKSNYAEIILYGKNGEVITKTIIDIEDIKRVEKIKWYLNARYVGSGTDSLLLHRYILNAPEGTVVHHINHNRLDNRKTNLRICSVTENANAHYLYKNNTSGITGIYLEKGQWRARIKLKGKLKSLGKFKTKEKAIIARKEAEIKYLGEFTPINQRSECIE